MKDVGCRQSRNSSISMTPPTDATFITLINNLSYPLDVQYWYYTEVGVSTVTYGPGALGVAHIADEYLLLNDFERMVYIYYPNA
jgi:hypothetical protein